MGLALEVKNINMVSVFKKKLDQLMGQNRNVLVEKQLKQEFYTDSDVVLNRFANIIWWQSALTRFFQIHHMTWVRLLNSCRKRHDDYFRIQFDKDADFKKLLFQKKYIEEAIRVFEDKITIVDNKVKKTQIKQDVGLYKGQIPQEFQEK